jgi:hypothetical protein
MSIVQLASAQKNYFKDLKTEEDLWANFKFKEDENHIFIKVTVRIYFRKEISL